MSWGKLPLLPSLWLILPAHPAFPWEIFWFYSIFSSKAVVRICILVSASALSSVRDHSSCMEFWHTHSPSAPPEQVLGEKATGEVRRNQNVKLHHFKMAQYSQKIGFVAANGSDLQAQFVRVCSDNQVLPAEGKHRCTMCHKCSTKQVQQATAW